MESNETDRFERNSFSPGFLITVFCYSHCLKSNQSTINKILVCETPKKENTPFIIFKLSLRRNSPERSASVSD